MIHARIRNFQSIQQIIDRKFPHRSIGAVLRSAVFYMQSVFLLFFKIIDPYHDSAFPALPQNQSVCGVSAFFHVVWT
nr:MAG TPA: hypothetical protein [Caudoviricetes sp.]